MLYLISLGLYEKEDMSLKALETAKKCSKLYLEGYTHLYKENAEDLSNFLGKKVIELDRKDVENDSNKLIEEAKDLDVGLLVGGDCLTATTHSSLVLEAKEKGVKVKIIHGSSIFTAITETGLFLYNFGKITSIPFENDLIETPYKVIKQNGDMHTLCLLDLRPKEKKYMRASDAVKYLLKLEEKRKEKVIAKERIGIICAGMGSPNQIIETGKLNDLAKKKIDVFPQCLIIPGKLHFMEEEFLNKSLR